MNSSERAKYRIGVIAVTLAVVIFGLAPPLARLAYDAGANPVTLVELRFVLATLLLLAFLAIRRRRSSQGDRPGGGGADSLPRFLHGAPITTLIVIGLATAVASAGYMASVELIPAGMAALLFYTFPIQVTVLAWAMGQESLTLAKLGAGVTCLIGIALAVGVAPALPNPIGVALALSGAAGVATLITLSAKVMRQIDQITVQTTSTVIALLCYTIWLIASGGPSWPATPTGWIALVSAALSSAVANIVFLFGLARIGAGRASLLANLEPLTVLALAPLLLNEYLTWPQLGGAALVLAAITILPIVEARKASR